MASISFFNFSFCSCIVLLCDSVIVVHGAPLIRSLWIFCQKVHKSPFLQDEFIGALWVSFGVIFLILCEPWFFTLVLHIYVSSVVTELRFSCSSLKNPILRDKCWVKGKIALLRKLTILGRRWAHVPKDQLPTADQGARAFKGECQGFIAGGRVLCAEQHSQLW